MEKFHFGITIIQVLLLLLSSFLHVLLWLHLWLWTSLSRGWGVWQKVFLSAYGNGFIFPFYFWKLHIIQKRFLCKHSNLFQRRVEVWGRNIQDDVWLSTVVIGSEVGCSLDRYCVCPTQDKPPCICRLSEDSWVPGHNIENIQTQCQAGIQTKDQDLVPCCHH